MTTKKLNKELLLIAYQEARDRVAGQVEFSMLTQNKATSLAGMFLMLATAVIGFSFTKNFLSFISFRSFFISISALDLPMICTLLLNRIIIG